MLREANIKLDREENQIGLDDDEGKKYGAMNVFAIPLESSNQLVAYIEETAKTTEELQIEYNTIN